MEPIRRVLAVIAKQLGKLRATQKLLIGALAVMLVMVLFLVSQYAGSPKMSELLPGAPPDAIARAQAYLEGAGIPFKPRSGKLWVPSEQYLTVVASLAEAGKLPVDSTVTFDNYIKQLSWMNPRSDNDRIFNTALENTLAACLQKFKGIHSATVVIDAPQTTGIGSIVHKPTASVMVVTNGNHPLEPATVDAIAAMVASAKSGLEPKSVSITDGQRKYAVRDDEDSAASTYMEHLAKVEEYIHSKLADHLAYIPGVSVAINAQVDVRKTTSKSRSVKKDGEGSTKLLSKESSTNSNQVQEVAGGEPGVRPNVSDDLNRSGSGGGSGGAKVAEETGDTLYDTQFGTEDISIVDPRGMATKINATIGVPRSYVVALLEQSAPAPAAGVTPAQPSEDEIKKAFAVEKARIEADIAPLIETDPRSTEKPSQGIMAGTVVVSMIPVPVPGGSGPGPSGGVPGGSSGTNAGMIGGGVGGLASSGLVKQALLGGLAVMAMAMMLMMVRKAAKPAAMPSAEELVGIPPALSTSNDLVGEADEGDTAMTGIEIDDNSLRQKKMLEEVSELVKNKPSEAATLFNRWVQTEA